MFVRFVLCQQIPNVHLACFRYLDIRHLLILYDICNDGDVERQVSIMNNTKYILR